MKTEPVTAGTGAIVCTYIMPGTNAAPMPFFRYSRDRLDFLSGVYDLFWDSVDTIRTARAQSPENNRVL